MFLESDFNLLDSKLKSETKKKAFDFFFVLWLTLCWTAAHYTAYFEDMDEREQTCLVNGRNVGAPLPGLSLSFSM